MATVVRGTPEKRLLQMEVPELVARHQELGRKMAKIRTTLRATPRYKVEQLVSEQRVYLNERRRIERILVRYGFKTEYSVLVPPRRAD